MEKLIEDAERCQRVIKDSDCQGCHYRYSDQCPCDVYEDVLKLKLHYESLLASERRKVIAEVREWSDTVNVHYTSLVDKLDSMEADKV